MEIEYFDFKAHLPSVAWMQELPTGLLKHPVDLRYSQVTITKEENEYQIYIGPKDPDNGGDALVITLDENLKLIDCYIERLEAFPGDTLEE